VIVLHTHTLGLRDSSVNVKTGWGWAGGVAAIESSKLQIYGIKRLSHVNS
jgi:hypothetical protein